VTVADGERSPGQGLCGGDYQGDQTHEVEHDAVQALRGSGSKTRADVIIKVVSVLMSQHCLNMYPSFFLNYIIILKYLRLALCYT
jgi:hypothetical protein